MSDALGPCGLYPTRLLCPWNSPGKYTVVGCHSLLQGGLLDPGFKPGSLVLQADFLPSEPEGKPIEGTYLLIRKAIYNQPTAEVFSALPNLMLCKRGKPTQGVLAKS